MRFANLLVFSSMAVLLVSGCDKGSSNPISQYSINAVPEHGKKQHTQDEMTNPLQIDIVGANETNFANFVEGQEGTVQFSVRVLLSEVKGYKLVPVQFPKGATFYQSQSQPNIWIMKWTPMMGMPTGSKFTIQIQGQIMSDNPLLKNVVTPATPFQITVSKSPLAPTIVGVGGIKDEVGEGETVNFSIDVRDPATTQLVPRLDRFPFDQGPNLENFKADASSYVQINPRQAVSKVDSNTWRFNFIFSTANRDLPLPLNRAAQADSKAEGINTCFNLLATSSLTGNSAPSKLVCIFIRYASLNPEITFEDPNPVSDVYAGQVNTIKFSARAGNRKGEVSIQNSTVGFSAWSGHPKLSCTDGNADSALRQCQIEWEIPCGSSTQKNYVFTVKATNHLNQKTKVGVSKRDIRVNLDKCPAVSGGKP